eukprot:GHUV01019758.1.p1 GENE.GHUV01019758.1~~GHUV01019758.1.p1  ORF type:complete len:453 (+),score=114.03 GHUV01019758.1:272-1630(+)
MVEAVAWHPTTYTLHPARNSASERWELYDAEQVIELPENKQLEAIVVVDVATIGSVGRAYVPLKEIVRSPMPWYAVKSKSTSSHSRNYSRFRCVCWGDLSDVLPLLDQYLGDKQSVHDPRESGGLDIRTQSELQANNMFLKVACQPAAAVVNELIKQNELPGVDYEIEFRVGQPAHQREGLPDFAAIRADEAEEDFGAVQHHLSGEGTVVTAFEENVTRITMKSSAAMLGHAKQSADYIRQRHHTYGFLTNHHGTFFFRRKADDLYEITDLIPWHQTGCGVIAMLTYITTKQLTTQPWVRSKPAAVSTEGLSVQTCSQRAAASSAESSAAAAPSSKRPRTRMQAQQQQQRVGLTSTLAPSSSKAMTYPMHYPEALQLTKRDLGHGMVGVVTAGRYATAWWAFARAPHGLSLWAGLEALQFGDVFIQQKLWQSPLQERHMQKLVDFGFIAAQV